MKNHRGQRRFHGRRTVLLEGLETRLLLSATKPLLPMDDGDDPDPVADPPPADTQPVDTQPAGNGSSDNGSGNTTGYNGTDDGGDVPPIVTPPAPDAPTSLTVQSPSPTSVYLSWSDDDNAVDSFTIQRRDVGNRWYHLATVDGDVLHFTDFDVQPGGIYSYRVFASNDYGNSPSTHAKTILVSGSTDATLVGQFGKIPGGSRSAPLTFIDTDDTAVMLKLRGPGTGTVRIGTSGYDVTLTGTTAGSAVKIVTRSYGDDDGRFTLESFAVSGATTDAPGLLGSLIAPTTDLRGTLDITGAPRTITLGNLDAGSTLSIGEAVSANASPVSLTCGQVTNTELTSTIPLRQLSVATWQNTGTSTNAITAPSLGTLQVRGGRGLAGDFAANLSLSATAGTTLGKATIAGTIASGTWHIGGSVGMITAEATNGWTLDLSSTNSRLANLSISTSLTSSHVRTAGSIGMIRAGALRDSTLFAGVSTASNALPGHSTDFISVTPPPTIASITIGSAELAGVPVLVNSSIAAATIGKVALPANPAAVASDATGDRFGFASLLGPVARYQGPPSTSAYTAGSDSQVS